MTKKCRTAATDTHRTILLSPSSQLLPVVSRYSVLTQHIACLHGHTLRRRVTLLAAEIADAAALQVAKSAACRSRRVRLLEQWAVILASVHLPHLEIVAHCTC